MSTSTTVWYNDYTIYNELLRLSRLHKFNQFTFEYLMKYAVKGSQVILDEIELLNSAEVEDDEKELITKKMLIVLKSYKHQCHDAASLCSLAPSPQGLTNDDEVGVQSADGVSRPSMTEQKSIKSAEMRRANVSKRAKCNDIDKGKVVS